VPLTDGAFVGGMARWVERALLPALVTQPVDDVDAQLVASLSGAAPKDAAVRRVAWEGRTYTVDHAGPEQRRLARVRDRMGAPSIRLALDLEHLATRVATASEVQPVRAALGELRQFASALTVKEKQAAVLPPGVEASKSPGDVANRVADELAKISRAQDLPKASSAIAPVFILCDEVLADALFSLAYALDLGSPDGTTLLGGNVSRRHDFGFAIRVDELRERAAWATPVRVISAGVPWHIGGSALSLDTALSSLALRRIDTGDLPQAPVLTSPDRDTFTKTLVLMNPFDLSDETRDAIVAAIERGRERVAAIARDPSLWDPTADEIRMDGWRRRAGKWALANDAAMVTSFFSLSELLHLGAPPPDLAVHAWGMARDASDACVCIEAPTPGRAAIVVGRPQFGLLAAEVADVNLHVAEVLRARGLPASLAPGVLAGALQDYIEKVRPMHPSDWLTLVREAQAIPEDRLDDYVAALTTGGPLAPERASASPEGGQR
jgi:hypothetical protein